MNADGSLNLLGLETVRLIYFKNKTAGETRPSAVSLSAPAQIDLILQGTLKSVTLLLCNI